jgi:proteasome lid subunit RPN8/RPN11
MLILPNEQENTIRNDGASAYPNECCGVLIGSIDDAGTKTVKLAQAIINSREDGEQYHRFLITPEDMLSAEMAARSLKLDVVGFYHSHPDHPAAPSGYDKEHALPFYSYVIVSVEKGAAKDLTSWELSADRAAFSQETVSPNHN